jgi:hypothetical protein
LQRTRKIEKWDVSETGIHSIGISEMFRMESVDYEPAWRNVPEPPVQLALERTRMEFHEDGYGRILWSFQGEAPPGLGGGSAERTIVKHLRGNTTREPIVSHPDIGKWIRSEDEGGMGFANGFEDGEPKWKTKDPRGISKKKGFDKAGAAVEGINPLYGVRDYLAAGAEYTETVARKGRLPSGLFAEVGRVFKNPPGMPVVPGRNWLMAGVSARQRGDSFEIRKHWLMSGIGGWLWTLYEPIDQAAWDQEL